MNKFVQFGDKKKIMFTEDEYKALNSLETGSTPLKLCGFKPISMLKPSDYVRGSHFLYPDEMTVEVSSDWLAQIILSSDWLTQITLSSDWLTQIILSSDWLTQIILSSDWREARLCSVPCCRAV